MKTGNNFIIGLIAFLPLFSYSQTVDFSFSTANNLYCSPQRVTFTQLCTGNPDGFIWRFGNGVSGILGTESTTYSAPGTYPVTLIAIYADVAISVTKNVVINPTPTISIAADKYELCQPGTVSFVASGSPFITSYEWNFGDGSPVITTGVNNTSHFFNSFNDFIVTVKGISAAGCSSSTFDTISVKQFGILDASIDPPGGCVPINALLSVVPDPPVGDPVVSYTWNFGDASPTTNTTTPSANHIYTITSPITTASVTITTASGCNSLHTYIPPFGFGTPPTNPVAVTTDGRTTYCASETIEFNGTATGANFYLWDYGDGIKDSVQFPNISHKYRSLGNKKVIMTPFFNGCPGLVSDTIDLNIIGVVADYKFHNICSAKNHFIFDNLSLGNVSSFRWTFSDIPNNPDFTNFNTTHDFPANGAFTTKFYLYDAITGCSDSLIYDQFTATPILTSTKTHVCKDSVIKYTIVNPYPPGSGYLYAFHVDGPIIAHTIYPELELKPDLHGVFNEFVVISGPDDNTCDDTVYLPGPTYVGGPILRASMPINSCFLNNSYPITNNSRPFFPNEPLITWEWDFGDNTTSNVPTPPPHSYSHYGTYWVHFKVTDVNGCSQADSQLVRVNPTPEIYVLPRADTICAGDSLQLLAFSVDNLVWTTNYNTSCLVCDTVIVKPLTTTNYIAEASNIFGCTNRDTSRIKVYEPFILRVTPADTSICIGEQVQFNMNVKSIINWSPPNYLSAVNISNPISKPDSSVTYRIIVNDSAACFADTAFAVVHVNYKPTVRAGNDQVIPYYNSFTLSPAYSADVIAWQWSPQVNSLSCTSCPIVSGIASQTTNYSIEVSNVHGCTARDEVKIIVACSKANLLLPSAFTPDNNGTNDWFYPLTRGYRVINKFVVYNRWGNKVFERYNFTPNIASLGWNGKGSDKQPIDAGVFVWVVEATCDVGQKIQSKGTVTLLH